MKYFVSTFNRKNTIFCLLRSCLSISLSIVSVDKIKTPSCEQDKTCLARQKTAEFPSFNFSISSKALLKKFCFSNSDQDSVQDSLFEMADCCAEKPLPSPSKWFERPKDPSNHWYFTEDAIQCIENQLGGLPGFQRNHVENESDFQSLSKTMKPSLLDSYLQDISENKAKFPDYPEAKLIFETFDEVVIKMTNLLSQKSKLFKDCRVVKARVKVGSTSEGLKSGSPNEFDYNLVLPQLSAYTNFVHSLHSNFINNAVHAQFFGEIDSARGDDLIFFEMETYDVLEGVVSKTELRENFKDEIALSSRVRERIATLVKEYNPRCSGNELDKSRERHAFSLTPLLQRSHFEKIFLALDVMIEDALKESLPETLKVLPKKAVRGFRSLNQIAITLNLLWKESLEISVDFALVIPAKKKPLWYDFDVYLVESGKSILPVSIPFQDANETYNYIIQSYNTCRLSTGETETKMFEKFPVDSVIKQSIRVCKKLRDIFMKHYFDIATESVTPVMPSYWIKTVAMHLFDISEPMKYDGNDVSLSKSVMEILRILHKCLTGDQGEKLPVLASYTNPFKNRLQPYSAINDDLSNVPYLEEELKEIVCRPNIVAAKDIQRLVGVLTRLEQDEELALNELEAMSKDNEADKITIHERGMREKLCVFLHQHFDSQEAHLSDDGKPFYLEFIKQNFPSMEVIPLEKEEMVVYHSKGVIVDVKLVENGEEVNLAEFLEVANNRINFFGVKYAHAWYRDCSFFNQNGINPG